MDGWANAPPLVSNLWINHYAAKVSAGDSGRELSAGDSGRELSAGDSGRELSAGDSGRWVID